MTTVSQAAHDAAVNIFVQILQARENPGTMTEDEVQQMVVDAFASFEATIRAEQASRPTNGPCGLCAGECRGHSLSDEASWEPEPGSRAAAALSRAEPDVEKVQRLQDHMEQHHGICLKASDWDAAIAAMGGGK